MVKSIYRSITVEKLKEILDGMANDYILVPNTIGNLIVLDKDGNYIGFIEIAYEEFQLV